MMLFIPNGHLNELQRATIRRLLDTLQDAHLVDIKVRKNGKDLHFEADWLKHLQIPEHDRVK